MTQGPYSIGSEFWPGTSKVIEEAGELLQVLGKLIGGGGKGYHLSDEELRKKLVEECGDLIAALWFFIEVNGIAPEVAKRSDRKAAVFARWHLKGLEGD